MSETFSCDSHSARTTQSSQQLWLNADGQSLKNEVSELQKILDEINQNSRFVQ